MSYLLRRRGLPLLPSPRPLQPELLRRGAGLPRPGRHGGVLRSAARGVAGKAGLVQRRVAERRERSVPRQRPQGALRGQERPTGHPQLRPERQGEEPL